MTNQITGREKHDRRQEIVQAAFEVLSAKGMERASIKEIALRARVAPGLVHYYFKDKEELLAAVVREVSTQFADTMRKLREATPARNFPDAVLSPVRDRVRELPGQYRMRFDLYAAGLRNRVLLRELRAMLLEARNGIGESLRQYYGADHAPVDVASLASVLFAAFDGLALQYLVDPDFDLDAAYAALSAMLKGLHI
ncbi:MAG: TetR/AcrR family transcriptional regulator [Candidatus Binataceae bacterium]